MSADEDEVAAADAEALGSRTTEEATKLREELGRVTAANAALSKKHAETLKAQKGLLSRFLRMEERNKELEQETENLRAEVDALLIALRGGDDTSTISCNVAVPAEDKAPTPSSRPAAPARAASSQWGQSSVPKGAVVSTRAEERAVVQQMIVDLDYTTVSQQNFYLSAFVLHACVNTWANVTKDPANGFTKELTAAIGDRLERASSISDVAYWISNCVVFLCLLAQDARSSGTALRQGSDDDDDDKSASLSSFFYSSQGDAGGKRDKKMGNVPSRVRVLEDHLKRLARSSCSDFLGRSLVRLRPVAKTQICLAALPTKFHGRSASAAESMVAHVLPPPNLLNDVRALFTRILQTLRLRGVPAPLQRTLLGEALERVDADLADTLLSERDLCLRSCTVQAQANLLGTTSILLELDDETDSPLGVARMTHALTQLSPPPPISGVVPAVWETAHGLFPRMTQSITLLLADAKTQVETAADSAYYPALSARRRHQLLSQCAGGSGVIPGSLLSALKESSELEDPAVEATYGTLAGLGSDQSTKWSGLWNALESIVAEDREYPAIDHPAVRRLRLDFLHKEQGGFFSYLFGR